MKKLRDSSPIPYIRERAAAILKIADGNSVAWVAELGLLRPHKWETVKEWLFRYTAVGIRGLFQRKRRTADKLNAEQKEEIRTTIFEKTPQDFGFEAQRWTLSLIREALSFFKERFKSLSGVWYVLQGLPCRLKRGLPFIKSPDPDFNFKIRRMRGVLGFARRNPGKVVVVFLDEFSFYRQPTIGRAWWKVGRREQPKANRSPSSDTCGRIVGTLNGVDGQLNYRMASKITVPILCQFLATLKSDIYPRTEKLYVVMDNWHNVHHHPRTVAKLKELGITPVWLPTYTPEANPIERIWWKLSEDIVCMHRHSDRWDTFKERIRNWLDKFQTPSPRTLKIAGLSDGRAIRVSLESAA